MTTVDAAPRPRHAPIGGNALRAAVLGANDGLVSNLSLIMGVAGAGLESRVILITGLAGLLAGASSMAMGEWVSVQSSRELYQRELAVERDEIARFPAEEHAELVGIYEARGLSTAVAQELATHVMADEERALEVMAREELGIDPDGLGGSAWTAAGSSFALFVAGAAIPVAWFAFLPLGVAVPVSLLASALGLFVIGVTITRVTDRPAWRSGLRQLAIGLAAAVVTYGTGVLLGVSVGA
ncbi:MAG TPA: VIT1/CCC1 transporter family protein [Solirubrobacteraceae bacterium]|nr:VIT1/CCC1 transporter family protein [Solirubrobacteraceae bacterium]